MSAYLSNTLKSFEDITEVLAYIAKRHGKNTAKDLYELLEEMAYKEVAELLERHSNKNL